MLRALASLFLFGAAMWHTIPCMGQQSVLDTFRIACADDAALTFDLHLPGTIQKGLLDAGLIPDPFVGLNEEKVQWVSDKDWTLSAAFRLKADEWEKAKEYLLRLSRVDTFAEITLNGIAIGRTDNYFRDYAFSVKEALRPGENLLEIRLLSTTKEGSRLYEESGRLNYPADNDRAEIHLSPFVRTSPYHFGWDWGPRLISMGIDAPVILERISSPLIQDLWVRPTLAPDHSSAEVCVAWKTAFGDDEAVQELVVRNPSGAVIFRKSIAAPAATEQKHAFTLNEPQLWWPVGMGNQPLYSVIVRTMRGGKTVDEKSRKFGVREIVLDQSKDQAGERFAFVVNGLPFYAKGANYLPHDRRFRGERDPYTLKELFEKDLLPVHINMLRVWGGGEYETEEFYALADSLGILVWQDFPFACTTYPNDSAFRAGVTAEVRDNLTRIRNHPSIALFCGNNEVLEGMNHWGWKEKYGYSDDEWEKMKKDYDDFFRGLLPGLVREYAPDVSYIHGSPVSSNWGDPASLLKGDSHYWGVWFGGEDFDTFDKNYGRFSSEFGFQAFPELKTIHSFAPDIPTESLSIDHPLMANRQRSFIGNRTITDYMQRHYKVPDDFERYLYVGQLLQGHGMDYAIRAVRRGFPQNTGLLFWQLNDVWPTVSWSSVDYFGNWKALHYKLRSALAPVIVDLIEQEGDYRLCLVSDTPLQGHITLRETALDFSGRRLWQKERIMEAPATVPFVQSFDEDAALFSTIGGQMVVRLEVIDEEGRQMAERLFYPLEPKELMLPEADPRIEAQSSDGKMTLTVSAEVLIKDLFFATPDSWQGARFSDNYFDLLPGETKVVTITHPAIAPLSGIDDLTIHTLNEL